MKLFSLVATLFGLLAISAQVFSQTYQSVLLDDAGQLSITLSSGSILHPPKLHDQVSFSQPLVSADHRTVAWLANYADPSIPQGSGDPLAGRLVAFRANRVLRSFRTDQVFWSWQFFDGDKDVAFCTGPTHGGASGCELHEIALWSAACEVEPPLRHESSSMGERAELLTSTEGDRAG